MATDSSIGASTQLAVESLVKQMSKLSELTGIPAPELPTDKDKRLLFAKQLGAIAEFLEKVVVEMSEAKLTEVIQKRGKSK